jgi:hypothetical protein
MAQAITAIVLIILAFVLILIIYRTNQNSLKKVLSGERSLDDREVFMRSAAPLHARVIHKMETLNPNAKGIAKVDIDLEISLPQQLPVLVTTCWLVEIPNLPELEPGKEVMVKFDPKKPKKVYPAVSWARLWTFD